MVTGCHVPRLRGHVPASLEECRHTKEHAHAVAWSMAPGNDGNPTRQLVRRLCPGLPGRPTIAKERRLPLTHGRSRRSRRSPTQTAAHRTTTNLKPGPGRHAAEFATV